MKKLKIHQFKCDGCGTEFERADTQAIQYGLKKGWKNYCTNECRLESRRKVKRDTDRIKELEKIAWSNMTGEDVTNNLSEKEADEYEKLMYEDD